MTGFDPFGPALSPVVLAALIGLIWLYWRGAARPRPIGERVGPVRHLLFAIAILLFILAFDAPLAPTGQQLFAVHQVQHLIVRLLGPMLFILAHPWPVLRAGLLRNWRHRLRDLGQWRPVGLAAGLLSRLDVSFILLVSSLYLWQVPAMHNAALAIPPLALLAHMSMVLTGLLFFSIIFDRRDAPEGAVQSLRLFALIGIIVSNILLGSLTTLKSVALYAGYGVAVRLWGFTPLADETIGGYTIWVPSSILLIVAIIVVFNGWNAAEVRRWNARHDWSGSNTAALAFPETADELRVKVATPNRRMSRTLALTAATMFAIVMITTTTLVYAL